MMTMQEANALPIPEQYKSTPNIYRLACIINSSKHADKIMAALPLFLANRSTQTEQKGGEDA